MKIKFKEVPKVVQQKGRRVPLQLQKAVDAEIRNLLDAALIRRFSKIADEMFFQLVVITVRDDRSVNIAIDARALNNVILKSKHQMPKIYGELCRDCK